MNAKQRKIAQKMRERAELDSTEQMKKLQRDRAEFEANKVVALEEVANRFHQVEQAKIKIANDRAEFENSLEGTRKEFLKGLNLVAEAKVVREVLLLLELDEDPAEIALKIRKQFGLLIPEW